MKYLIKASKFFRIFLSVIFVVIVSNICNINCVQNNITYSYYETSRIKYAKVKENCFLFKTSDVTDASYRNVEFIIPESYFVIVLNNINTMITKVQYKNKIGYVSSDSIKVVDFLPVNPTLDYVTFDINENVGTQLRSSPNADDSTNITSIVPAGTENITYVASTYGVIPTGGNSNVWYYAIYSPISDPTSVYEGYIYSGKTENLSKIELNSEDIYEITENNKEDKDNSFVINNGIKTLLIIIICVPIVLIFIILIVGNKRNKNENFKTKETYIETNKELENRNNKNSYSLKFKKPSDFANKKLKKKSNLSKYITQENQTMQNNKPRFPTYEIIDDDDLL